MSDNRDSEQRAFMAALAEIERVRTNEWRELSFDRKEFRALTALPDTLQRLTFVKTIILSNTQVTDLSVLKAQAGLRSLYIDRTPVKDLYPIGGHVELERLSLCETAVTDIAALRTLNRLQFLRVSHTSIEDINPIRGLTNLEELFLDQTEVDDLAPVRGLTKLRKLSLDRSAVADLRPISQLERLWIDADGSISFQHTRAIQRDPQLARLSLVENDQDRTRQTLAYLRTLPPWPEPLPGLRRKSEPLPPEEPPLTVTAIIEAQDLAGWRFSPAHGALELFIRNEPVEARQQVLATMSSDRVGKLVTALGNRINAGGLRQEVFEEAKRFQDILADSSRSLAMRSLELWGSLIALGAQLESNDAGAREGRDKLDLLPAEARAALDTLLGVASGLVRSFPEARALDDEHASFTRRKVTRETILALLEEALRTRLVTKDSIALMQHVQGVSEGTGKQAEKSATVTTKGMLNMLSVAGWLKVTAVGAGAVAGSAVVADVVTDLSNHYELGEKAGAFFDAAGAAIIEFAEGLAPDERARVKAALEQAQHQAGNPQ